MTVPAEVVTAVEALFAGRRDVYAEGYPDPLKPSKYRYAAVDRPLTSEDFRAHLAGEKLVGIYSLMEDSTAQWFAIDIDAPKLEDGTIPENSFDAAYQEACAQAAALEAAGLMVYLERSRSGTGVHIWGFLDAPVSGEELRRAIRPYLRSSELLDRMYPVQDAVTPRKPYGNLICMPFAGQAMRHGNTMFLDAAGQPIQVRKFLTSVRRIPAAVIQHLASKAPKPAVRTVDEDGSGAVVMEYGPPVSGFLKVLSPYGCRFVRHCWQERRRLPEPAWYAMIQITTHFVHGRQIAHLMSRDYAAYDEGQTDAKFDQAQQNPRIGCQWIHENYPELACDHCPMRQGKRLAPHHLASRSILDLCWQGSDMTHVGSFAEDLQRIKRFDAGTLLNGYRWNIEGLDRVTRLRNSELVIVGGMQSMGKTHFMTDGTYSLATSGTAVMVFSAETGRTSHRDRMLARAARINSMKLRGEFGEHLTKADWAALEKAAAELEQLPIFCDYTSITADEVLRQVERVILEQGRSFDSPYVIFFDYLQFGMKTAEDASEYERLSRLSSEFKYTAKITGHPAVVLSQLQRDCEGDEHPTITAFKGTGRIESDADVAIIITGSRVEGSCAPRSLWFVKQREGQANIKVDFVLEQGWGEWRVPDNKVMEQAGFTLTEEDHHGE